MSLFKSPFFKTKFNACLYPLIFIYILVTFGTKDTLTLEIHSLNTEIKKGYVNFFNCGTSDEKSSLINILSDLVTIEPKNEVYNDSCTVPELPDLHEEFCRSYFHGQPVRYSPNLRKIAHIVSFSFEIDVLEVLLNEIYDVVDKIFVFESKYTFGTGLRKPLLLNKILKFERFKKFHDKVIPFELPESLFKDPGRDFWRNERITEEMRFKLFLEWNEQNGNYFNDDDYIGFGDTDEIPWRENLHALKYCDIPKSVDIGIWNTFSTIHKKHLGDFPVRGEPFSLGDPTYYRLSEAKKVNSPTRRRGASQTFMKGGLHMTRYPYFPSLALKLITQSEAYLNDKSNQYQLVKHLMLNDIDICNISNILVKNTHNIKFRSINRNFYLNKDELGKGIYKVPWFLECNPKRFPHFFNDYEIDHRLVHMCSY